MGFGRGLVAFCLAVAAPAAALGQTPTEPTGSRPAPAATAFVHVAVIPMDRERVLEDQTVVVEGGRVVALGPAGKVRVPAGATRVDGRGRFLTPGLADMHVHLRGMSGDSAQLRDFLFALLATGVTTIRDMHSGGGDPRDQELGTWTLAVRERLARGELLGPHLYTAGDPDYTSPAAAARSMAKLKADGHDFVKVYSDPYPPEVFDSIKASANRVGLRMVGHVPVNGFDWTLAAPFASIEHSLIWLRPYIAEKMGIVTDTAAGTTPRWKEPGFQSDPTQVRAVARAMRRAGVWSCPTMAIGDAMGGDVESVSRLVKGLYGGGMRLLTGTDLGDVPPLLRRAGYHGQTVTHEVELFVQVGLTPFQALATSTRDVAEFLGTLDSSGTIAVGKRADLVLVSANPLRDVSHMRARVGVMIGGRWLPKAELDRGMAAIEERMRQP